MAKSKKKPIVKRIVAVVSKTAGDRKLKQLVVDLENVSARTRAAMEDGTLTVAEIALVIAACAKLVSHLATKGAH